MKTVRLLPVVVFSAAALLLFKGVGLVTNGGYVLTGVTIATSAGGGGGHGGGGGGEAAAGAALPSEPTMVDTAPTIFDKTPTLGEGGAAAGGHGAPAAGGHGEAAAAPTGEHGAAAPASGHGAGTEASATNSPDAPNPDANAAALAANRPKCAVEISAEAEEGGKGGGGHGGGDVAAADHALDCVDMTDAVAVEVGPDGKLVTLASADGTQATEQAVLARLSERRDVLDAQSQELDMRAVLVDAAEKRLEERAAQVAAMEAQINALVEEKKAMEEAQLQSIVAMYQTMKPKDAAKIFDTLDMDVLVRVARTMSARKLAPIVAGMSAEKAQALTIELAQITPEPSVGKQASVTPASTNPAASTELPQIVGQ